MFDISWTELMVIAAVALIVIGPKDLPRALRTLGNWTAKVKSMAREFQLQLDEAVREAELDSIKKEIDDLSNIDPAAALKEPTPTQPEIRKSDEPSVAEDQGTKLARPTANTDGREDTAASRLV